MLQLPVHKDVPGGPSEVFHSDAEITGYAMGNTANAGSYGVMYQLSLPTYQTVNFSGVVCRGHPAYSSPSRQHPA